MDGIESGKVRHIPEVCGELNWTSTFVILGLSLFDTCSSYVELRWDCVELHLADRLVG